ncbi:ATP-binding cassette sub- G member 2 [Chytriomyces hyalinus]|nr:ATP-binding cassette sub- G member 2 [Chytriomyces hyalinus]
MRKRGRPSHSQPNTDATPEPIDVAQYARDARQSLEFANRLDTLGNLDERPAGSALGSGPVAPLSETLRPENRPIQPRPSRRKNPSRTPATTAAASRSEPLQTISNLEVVLSVAVLRPYGKTSDVLAEFLVLGSQTLAQLKDAIPCISDRVKAYAPYGTAPGQEPTRLGNNTSGYFLIEGCFYNDLRHHSAKDYSSVIVDWIDECPDRKDHFKGGFEQKSMAEKTFQTLTIKLEHSYLYVHQACCEHVIRFKDVRLISESDDKQFSSYPKSIFQSPETLPKKCQVCERAYATRMTIDDLRVPSNPYSMCEKCFSEFFNYEPMPQYIIMGNRKLLRQYKIAKTAKSVSPEDVNDALDTMPEADDVVLNVGQGSNEIRWSGVNYSVPFGKGKEAYQKQLLVNATGYVRQGQVVAIMGGSGAGKSTLLNTLAGRIADQKGSELTGDILINGEARNPNTWRNICSYVEQDDLMFTNLSVEETLTYAAKLRLPSKFSDAEKKEEVDKIIMQLNLNNCRKTWIGNSLVRGISGGERKRVSIGVELVTKPKILFLDEPTSGLDSSNALGILETIKRLAVERGMIVLMTIHQPRTEILDLFDKILLLSVGKTLWFGPTNDALVHFAEMGYPLPPKTNPSDFFLDVITLDGRTDEARKISLERINKLHESYNTKYGSHTSPFLSQLLKMDTSQTWPLSWTQELAVLLNRNMKDLFRDKGAIGATIGQAIFLVLLMGFVFFRLDNDAAGVQSRVGFLFFICINQTFGVVMPAIGVFPTVRTIFKRERAAGCYRASSCFIGKVISALPLCWTSSLLMSLPLYWMVGLQPDVTKYFTFVCLVLIHSTVALAMAYCIGSAVPNAQVGQILGPLIITVFLLFGGQLLNVGSVSWVFRWLQYISIIGYTYKGLMQNEFDGLSLKCSPAMRCETYFGETVVAQFALESPTIWYCVLINCCIGIVLLGLGYTFFQRTSRPLLRLQ